MTVQHDTLTQARFDRRQFLAASLGAAALFGGVHTQSGAQAKELRIGYQKGSATLLVLKANGELEKTLRDLGYTTTWTEFQAAIPLLEALNAGSLDYGNTGAAPVIFAQAAGADLIYALASKSSPKSQGIIVLPDSPIQTLEDLKGKKIAAALGSVSLALLVKALQTVGLTLDDVEPTFLFPADAKPAFVGGNVDAWVIWDPYYALEEESSKARTIATNESVGFPSRGFYLADRTFANENAEAISALSAALQEADAWVDEHPQEVAEIVSKEIGIDVPVLLKVEERRVYGLEPVTSEVVKDQQELADLFYDLDLIPERVDVSAATLPEI
jgi:sulfonate transport system substrate-binding protein